MFSKLFMCPKTIFIDFFLPSLQRKPSAQQLQASNYVFDWSRFFQHIINLPRLTFGSSCRKRQKIKTQLTHILMGLQAQRRRQTHANEGQWHRVNQQVFHISVILQHLILEKEELLFPRHQLLQLKWFEHPFLKKLNLRCCEKKKKK